MSDMRIDRRDDPTAGYVFHPDKRYRAEHVGTYGRPPDFRGRGPRGYKRPDARIREEVCDRLADHPYLDASHLFVAVKDGEVTLEGWVQERGMKRLAEDLAEHVSGVHDIHNRIALRTGDARLDD